MGLIFEKDVKNNDTNSLPVDGHNCFDRDISFYSDLRICIRRHPARKGGIQAIAWLMRAATLWLNSQTRDKDKLDRIAVDCVTIKSSCLRLEKSIVLWPGL